MKTLTRTILLTGTLALIPALASAQAPQAAANASSKAPATSVAQGSPTQGATVYDTAGNVVGTIEAIDNQFATLATTKSKVKLPLTSFAAGPKGPLLGMTAAQVDAAAGAAAPKTTATAAATPPKLTKGTAVTDTSGAPVGTIDSVDGQFATVATAKSKVRLPLNAFASNSSGDGAVIGMTAAQLEAAASASTPKSGS